MKLENLIIEMNTKIFFHVNCAKLLNRSFKKYISSTCASLGVFEELPLACDSLRVSVEKSFGISGFQSLGELRVHGREVGADVLDLEVGPFLFVGFLEGALLLRDLLDVFFKSLDGGIEIGKRILFRGNAFVAGLGGVRELFHVGGAFATLEGYHSHGSGGE